MVHDGAVMIVEGPGDARFWELRRHRRCELIEGEGKTNVVESIVRLGRLNCQGVLGIVDDDYDSLLGVKLEAENVLVTDAHDLECMLCRSSALDAVFAEFGSRRKIERFEESEGVDVRTGVLERTLHFGRLRWAAEMHDLDIDKGAIRAQRFVDLDTWSVGVGDLIRAVIRRGSKDDEVVVRRCISALPEADPWCVAHGHDMLVVLCAGLRRVLGDLRASVGVEGIARVLRAGMSKEELGRTRLVGEVRVWEAANVGYDVLSA